MIVYAGKARGECVTNSRAGLTSSGPLDHGCGNLVNDRLAQHLANNAALNVGRGLAPAEQVGYMLSCVRRGYAKSLVRRRGQAPALQWVQT